MATDNGSIKTSDPRYKEGYKIVMPQKSKTKSKEKLTDSELNTLEKSKQHKKLTTKELNTLKKEMLKVAERTRKELIKGGSM